MIRNSNKLDNVRQGLGMENLELELLKLGNRLDKVEDCQTELRERVDDVPTEQELNQVQLKLAREAWELQKKELPALVRQGLIEREKEREDEKQKTLTELGLEIGPDGQPRPKGGAVKAFFRKNGTTIALIGVAIVIIRPDLIVIVFKLIMSIWGL